MQAQRIVLFLALTVGTCALAAVDTPAPGKPPVGPLTPREALASFRVPKGFKVELVACEPDVIDPVAMAFDEDGRLYVAEMHGYPNGGLGTGTITSGKIKLLEDLDGDGIYEKSTVFADGLRFPTAMMPYKGGLLVAVAPDLIYLEGPDASGKSKGKRTLYTGFDLANIQQLLNGLQWGLDNWVYGCAGGKGGEIKSVEKPDAPSVTLRGRGIRLHPNVPGSLEPMSGGGQFGLAADDWQHWFTATNSQHLRQIVLPDHYLRRNPNLPVPAVTLDIPDHSPACKVYRTSPFEAWRVERTMRRKDSPDSKRFPTTELVPGGFITSACSPVIYTGGLFPKEFHGNSLVCDPANNLIHRDLLVDQGTTFVAKRAEPDCEFFTSTDVWCRPVNLLLGPDGAVYVCDFYREVIETPISLPEDIRKKLNLESRGRGRIWRITPENAQHKPTDRPRLSKATTAELVKYLDHANSWYRYTAQRLLIERQDKSAVESLTKLATASVTTDQGRVHALWTLHGLKALDDALIETNLKSVQPSVCEQALRLADDRLTASAALRKAVAGLAEHESPRVRFQLAFTLGSADAPELVTALGRLARRDGGNPWFQTALLSSAAGKGSALLESLIRDGAFIRTLAPEQRQFLMRLATLVGASRSDADLARALELLSDAKAGTSWQLAVLEGLGQGLQISQRPLRKIWEEPAPVLKDAVAKARPFFERAALTACDEKKPQVERLAAVRLLGIGPFAVGSGPLQDLLTPQHDPDIQLAAARALAGQDNDKIAALLLVNWSSYGPSMRREVTEALVARPERIRALLDAVEKKKVAPAQIESARVEQLRKHPDLEIRKRAVQLFAGRAAADRQKVIDEYKPALDLKGDPVRGKMAFKKNCAVCHRLDNEGVEVGADLQAALKTKTPEALLVDILDPSREVDPRYINYVVTTKNGRILTGIIAVEAPSSITLRRAEKAEDTILRSELDEIQATTKSLMPDELEKQLSKQDLADLIAFLLGAVAK